ncbi:acetyl-CoA carboxylase, carboxyltransferase subunit beta [Zavarzinia sp. CC-PAN008]|uniref:acetyl-CoA carboxylase, carboxyltransferase subunit beta n=1 Tax=Zavarzinia sp. CC-PAN008 TaxID=3243332 RepID=UPI003F7427BC
MANWLTDYVRPGIRSLFGRKETPDNLWTKCPSCGQMIFHREYKDALFVCEACGHHGLVQARDRLAQLLDAGYTVLPVPAVAADPLKFRDEKKYVDRLKEARTKTQLDDAVLTGSGTMDGQPAVVSVQSFAFMGGSMGMAVGESLVGAAQEAIQRKAPLIVLTASGGARMQEGTLSLMQMPRTTVAVEMVKEAGLPYIVVLTNPTTGGVTASFAMLGDVHLAEPKALIGFSGARVIEQTIRERLPEGFQRAEFLNEHGMVDQVVHRHDLKPTLVRLIRLLMRQGPTDLMIVPEADPVPEPAAPAS